MSAAVGAELMHAYAHVHDFEPRGLRFWFRGADQEQRELTEGVLVDQGVTRGMLLTVSPSSAYTEELEALRKEGEHVGRSRCETCGEESEELKTCTACKEVRHCNVACQ